MRNRLLRCCSRTLTGAVLLLRLAALSATETTAQSPERGKQPTSQKASSATPEKSAHRANGPITLTIHLVDGGGKPVPGAFVGENAYGDSANKPKWSFYTPRAKSNGSGDARLRLETRPSAPILLYALHLGRSLTAFQVLADAVLDRPVTITLVPACHVTGRLVSADFDKLRRPLEWTNVYLYHGKHRSLNFMSKRQEFEFFLPPGQYELSAYGTHMATVSRKIEVKPNQPELSIGKLNLPADTLARRFGRPAPEFRRIKGWKNGGPTTLAQLRGKVVVLDFWGFWCGPCMSSVPDWMSLHDDYAELGLIVIGVHDDSVDDLEALDRKLAFAREHAWWGRDVPYLVALDGGGKTRIEGTGMDARGATTAAYGITSFPTGVLIDRDGTLVGDFVPNSPEGLIKLRQLLGVKPSPDPLVLTHKPAWRKRFDSQCLLASSESLRHFPKFLQSRAEYVTGQLNRIGGVGEFPQRLTIFLRDRTAPSESYYANSGDATLESLLSALAPPNSPPDAYDCPQPLAKLKIPGDWVVRESSSWSDRLKSLERILEADFGKKIHFERSKVEQEVVVASGRYKFRPLLGAVDRGINVTTDENDLQSSAGGGSGNLADLFGWLSHSYGRPFLDEVEEKPSGTINWWQRTSAIDVFKKANKLKATLEILTRQTGLNFQTTRRQVDVWHVREIQ
jgi:thiol-disulfide isomerase/thioredoxin